MVRTHLVDHRVKIDHHVKVDHPVKVDHRVKVDIFIEIFLLPEQRWTFSLPLEGEHCVLEPSSVLRSFPVPAWISAQSGARGALRRLVERNNLAQKREEDGLTEHQSFKDCNCK